MQQIVNKNLVILFTKEPKLGFVKTRLAKSCGGGFTLELYKKFVLDLVGTLQICKFDFKLCAYPNLEIINKIFGDFGNFLQCDGDLGVKMQTAFSRQFEKGYEKILLIGSDTPHLDCELLAKSFNALDNHEAVLGPSVDGGYYLIGFNKHTFCKDVFSDIPWSTDMVLKKTLHRLNTKRIYFLQELNDIDVFDDLSSFYDEHKDGYFQNSNTILFLKENSSWKNLMS